MKYIEVIVFAVVFMFLFGLTVETLKDLEWVQPSVQDMVLNK